MGYKGSLYFKLVLFALFSEGAWSLDLASLSTYSIKDLMVFFFLARRILGIYWLPRVRLVTLKIEK